MYDVPSFAFSTFGYLLLTLALGVTTMVVAAFGAERFLAQGAMRRVLWQAVLLGFGGLLVFELTGAGQAVSGLLVLGNPAEVIQGEARPGDAGTGNVGDDASVGFQKTYPGDFTPGTSTSVDCRDFPRFAVPLEERALLVTNPLAYDEFVASPMDAEAMFEGPTTLLCESVVSPMLGHETADEPLAANPAVPGQVALGSPSNVPKLAAWGLVVLWFGGVCFFVGRATLVRLRLNRLRSQWRSGEDHELDRLVVDLRRRIGMKQVVRICVAEELPTPVAFGVRRPTVLVPSDFTKRFSGAQQQVILAHELAHLAGADPAWLLAGELITALLWWHPLVHVARLRLLAASEQAADEASVLVPDGPDVLADCLVKLGRRFSGKPRLGWMAAEGSGLRSGLARRVQRLLKLSDRPVARVTRRVPAASKPVAVVLLMVLTISCTLWVRPKTTYAKGEEAMNMLRGSWRQSLAAVALTALLGPAATDAVADEAPDQPPKPAQLEDGSPVDQVLLADRGDRERGDRERGDREARERREGDRGREHREQEGREHRERGERDRDAEPRQREARERADRGREEHRVRRTEESEELRQRGEEIEREKAELQRDAEASARELETESRKIQEQREEIAREIKEIQEHLAKRKKKLAVEAEGDEEEEAHESLEIEIDAVAGQLKWAQKYFERLTGRAEQLTRELGEHRANAQRRMAELERASAEVRTQLARLEAARREDPERAEIMKRYGELGREIIELRRAGKHEEAERLLVETRELDARLGGRDHERERAHRLLQERLPLIERELHKAREAGRHEVVEQLERHLQEVRQGMQTLREGDRPGPPPELQAKIEHLRVAMENLHAAGLHDQAEQIAKQIERITREDASRPPERYAPHARPRGPRDEGRPERGEEIAEHLRGEIEQLRRENEELRHMMQELREAMNELRERR